MIILRHCDQQNKYSHYLLVSFFWSRTQTATPVCATHSIIGWNACRSVYNIPYRFNTKSILYSLETTNLSFSTNCLTIYLNNCIQKLANT